MRTDCLARIEGGEVGKTHGYRYRPRCVPGVYFFHKIVREVEGADTEGEGLRADKIEKAVSLSQTRVQLAQLRKGTPPCPDTIGI
jgi:hypothetical protein